MPLPAIAPELLAALAPLREPLRAYGLACGDARRLLNAFCQAPERVTDTALFDAIARVRAAHAAIAAAQAQVQAQL